VQNGRIIVQFHTAIAPNKKRLSLLFDKNKEKINFLLLRSYINLFNLKAPKQHAYEIEHPFFGSLHSNNNYYIMHKEYPGQTYQLSN
jgi:hypothetical protein